MDSRIIIASAMVGSALAMHYFPAEVTILAGHVAAGAVIAAFAGLLNKARKTKRK